MTVILAQAERPIRRLSDTLARNTDCQIKRRRRSAVHYFEVALDEKRGLQYPVESVLEGHFSAQQSGSKLIVTDV
jgi:hypothetical protein